MTKITIPAAERVKVGISDVIAFRMPEAIKPAVVQLVKSVERLSANQYTITIDKPRRRRTTGRRSQNARINGHIQVIAAATGNDFDDVKMYVKQRAVSMGYPMLLDEDGNVVVSMLNGSPLGQSESDCSVEEAKILIEQIHLLAASIPVILPEHEDDNNGF